MPSVVGLLERRELNARRRAEELREEADRIHAELDVAEREWNEWLIARSRVGEVLAPGDDAVVDPDASAGLPASGGQPVRSGPTEAAKPKSVVPMWRAGLAWSAPVGGLPAHPAGSRGPEPTRSRTLDVPGNGLLLRSGPGAREG